MSIAEERENFYLLLDLEYDPVEERSEIIDLRIKEKQLEWSSKVIRNKQYKIYLELLPEIKNVMKDANRRRKEALEARRLQKEDRALIFEKLDAFIALMCKGKSSVPMQDVAVLQEKFPELTVKEITARVPISVNPEEMDATVFQIIQKNLAVINVQYLSLYDFLEVKADCSQLVLEKVILNKDRELKQYAKKDARLTAAQNIVGKCMDILLNDLRRKQYDYTLLRYRLSSLDDHIEIAAGNARYITTEAAEMLEEVGLKNQLSIEEVVNYIQQYCRERQIMIQIANKTQYHRDRVANNGKESMKKKKNIIIKNENEAIDYGRKLVAKYGGERGLQRNLYALSNDSKAQKKISNAIEAYVSLEKGEIPIICFDDTAFGSARDGFLITSKAVYFHEAFSNPKKFLFEDIEEIKLEGVFIKDVFINNYKVDLVLVSSNRARESLCELFKQVKEDFEIEEERKNERDEKDCEDEFEDEFEDDDEYEREAVEKFLVAFLKLKEDRQTPRKFKNQMFTLHDEEIGSKLENAFDEYCFIEEGEIPLVCFDDTVFGSARDGCILTNRAIYIHNAYAKPIKILYEEIKSIERPENAKNYLLINSCKLKLELLDLESTKLFEQVIKQIVQEFSQ